MILPFEPTEKEDSQYFHFGTHTGLQFEEVTEGQYEMVIVRKQELDLVQAVFVTFPDLQEYRTKDLWSKHPTKPDHWFYEGRGDDIIVFANGEKLNPLTMEQTIESHPDVSAALVTGTGRFQSCLLVEPHKPIETGHQREKFLEDIWVTVEKANQTTVTHGRVDRPSMLITTPGKPFLRAGKGSVQRKATLNLYAKELEAHYDTLEHEDAHVGGKADETPFASADSTRMFLRRTLEDLGLRAFSDDADLFSCGLDSLQATNLTRRINGANKSTKIGPKTIYANPTVNGLVNHLAENTVSQNNSIPASRNELLQSRLDELSKDLPINARTPHPQPALATVVITGSTGSLGSYLLDKLLQDSRVQRVVCLNRRASAATDQRQMHDNRGLSVDFTKAEFLQSNVSEEHLGLKVADYRRLLGMATHVLHNAWPVNFNQALTSFQPQMEFLRRLVQFSSDSTFGAHLYFVSTIGTVLNYVGGQRVPEQILEDWSVSQPNGYAESKHVSEQLLARASSLGNPATVCRVGQIAGPVLHGGKGEWQKQEWLPSLIASSLFLKKIPSSLGAMDEVDWLPVDVMASVMVDLLLNATTNPSSDGHSHDVAVHHLVNPAKTSWLKLSPTVLDSLAETSRPQVVSIADWVQALEASAEQEDMSEPQMIASNPAVKILDFFKSLNSVADAGNDTKLPTLDVSNTMSRSKELTDCGEVKTEWMTMWMKQWNFKSK